MKKLRIKLTFDEPVLGTSPANQDLLREFVASKAPDAAKMEEEVAENGVEAVLEKLMTVFPRTEGGVPFLWDYQVKGFFKGACGFLRNAPDTKSAKIKAYKKHIDGLVFVSPRRVLFRAPDGGAPEVGECARPLRASTPQGERTALACSEEIPAGSSVEFTVTLLNDALEPVLREWLDYGSFSGLGQWRNSGKGRFRWEELAADAGETGVVRKTRTAEESQSSAVVCFARDRRIVTQWNGKAKLSAALQWNGVARASDGKAMR